MGFTELFSDFYAALSFPELHAEAPKNDSDDNNDEDKDDSKDEGKDDTGGKDDEDGDEKEGDEKDDGDGKEGGEDGEEEEEEEPEDPKPKLEEDCANSAECAPAKHHYDDCVKRVTAAQDEPEKHKGHKEDCVEEFFHLQHCATQCAAPKLFKLLK